MYVFSPVITLSGWPSHTADKRSSLHVVAEVADNVSSWCFVLLHGHADNSQRFAWGRCAIRAAARLFLTFEALHVADMSTMAQKLRRGFCLILSQYQTPSHTIGEARMDHAI